MLFRSPIARILGSASVHEDLIDSYRAADADFDYALEERWVREEGWLKIVPSAIESAASDAGIGLDQIDHVALHGSTSTARALAKRLNIEAAKFVDPMQGSCGDTGAAHPLLLLTQALAAAGNKERILVVGFGQGSDAIIVETTEIGRAHV